MLDAVEAPVLVLDGQGRIVFFNGAFERLSGYKRREVVGRVLWDVMIPPAEADDVRVAMSTLRAAAFPNSLESHWLTRAHELRHIRWHNTCLTDRRGAVTHVVATGMDVTERGRHSEMDLVDAIMENLPNHIYFKDRESRFVRISRSQAAALDLSDPAAAVGKTDFDFFSIEHAQAAFDDEREIIRTGLPFSSEEKETRTGQPDQWVMTTKLPWRDRNNKIIGTFGVSADITGRRLADERLRERERLFAALASFDADVNAVRDPDSLVADLVDAVGTVVPSDWVAITMLDSNDGRYRVRAVRGMRPGSVGSIIEPGEGIAGRVVNERALVATEGDEEIQAAFAVRDCLPNVPFHVVGVPLIIENTVQGVIVVGRADRATPFTQAEREVLTLLGSHAALALANAYLVGEVSELAIRDGLTGLYNRRHFDAEMDLAIERYKRHQPTRDLAVIMFDLDHFGDFNRHHGHLAGDAALRLFGDILRTRLRSADIVARYGGEEFIAVLEDCGLPEAAGLAEAVRRELAGCSVPDSSGRPIGVSVSAGCAVIDPAHPTVEALVGLADARLFIAKETGRNRVVWVEDALPRPHAHSGRVGRGTRRRSEPQPSVLKQSA